jgi:secondary thiamine-phosphate synthase enzyme
VRIEVKKRVIIFESVHMQTLTISTQSQKEIIDISTDVQQAVQQELERNGIVNVHVMHTTAAVTTADLDPGTDEDIMSAFQQMVPGNDQMNYNHPHDPEHTPDHILSSLVGTDVTVPIEQGRLLLGTWQHIILCEFDGPRERSVVVTPFMS